MTLGDYYFDVQYVHVHIGKYICCVVMSWYHVVIDVVILLCCDMLSCCLSHSCFLLDVDVAANCDIIYYLSEDHVPSTYDGRVDMDTCPAMIKLNYPTPSSCAYILCSADCQHYYEECQKGAYSHMNSDDEVACYACFRHTMSSTSQTYTSHAMCMIC